MNPPSDQQAFDEALRRLHIDAVAQVSPRTQAQLRVRRRAAASGQSSTGASPVRRASPGRRFGWPVAASFAALLALAFGMQMRKESLPSSTPSVPALAVVQDDDDIDTTLAALDENPDFYVWLASNDGADLASE